MTTPMSQPTPLSETWTRAIRELEWRLAIADTPFGQSYRAGTSLRETLLISTAARHHSSQILSAKRNVLPM